MQAIAALAYGTETIAPVDTIVGPGNGWVTAAKVLGSTSVGIDLPAGPREVVLIADATADPAQCDADLLAQAEHGPDSSAILLSLDPSLSAAVGRLVDGHDNPIDVSGVDVSTDGIEIQDREFLAAVREGREPATSVARCLPTMKTLDRLERDRRALREG